MNASLPRGALPRLLLVGVASHGASRPGQQPPRRAVYTAEQAAAGRAAYASVRRLPPDRPARPQRSAGARRPELHERVGARIDTDLFDYIRRRCRRAGRT